MVDRVDKITRICDQDLRGRRLAHQCLIIVFIFKFQRLLRRFLHDLIVRSDFRSKLKLAVALEPTTLLRLLLLSRPTVGLLATIDAAVLLLIFPARLQMLNCQLPDISLVKASTVKLELVDVDVGMFRSDTVLLCDDLSVVEFVDAVRAHSPEEISLLLFRFLFDNELVYVLVGQSRFYSCQGTI